MLRVNLDQILLLRFNSLGLRISIVAMMVYCAVCLPIYFYAQCAHVPLGDFDGVYANCTTEDANYTFSSYSRFTLANVPDLNADFLKQDYHLASFVLYCIVSWSDCLETPPQFM